MNGRPLALIRFLVFALLGSTILGVAWSGSAHGMLRGGPSILEEAHDGVGPALGVVDWSEVRGGRWPSGLVEAVRQVLAEGGDVLLVGSADPAGPARLNRTLALQYAVNGARTLARAAEAGLARFGCATAGEASVASLSVWRWRKPVAASPQEGPLTVLEPTAHLPSSGLLWALWDPASTRVLWARRGAMELRAWELDARSTPIRLPLPAGEGGSALGVVVGSVAAGRRAAVDEAPAGPERDGGLRLLAGGWWAAHLEVRVPEEWSRPVVWASGIPYPIVPGPGGRTELWVATLPGAGEAYLQATDRRGRAVWGPSVDLPMGDGDPPDLLAVLVWDGRGVDLDLHAWSGNRHTHPRDPDAFFSKAAVPGTRLLFDGGAEQPAAALAGWDVEGISLEARCYSDLGREGARAWLYLARNPGDPLEAHRLILGPRRLSERPLEARWPIYPP